MSEHNNTHHAAGHPGYEVTDVHTPPIWKFLSYLFVITFTAIALMYGMFHLLKGYNEASDGVPTAMEQQRSLPVGTRLQVNEPQDLKTFRAKEQAAVTTYAWEDKSAKVVRIPVARAMELVAEKGLPKFDVPSVKPGTPAAKPAAPAKAAQ